MSGTQCTDELILPRLLVAAAALLASATNSVLHFTITLRSLFDCCVQDAYSVSEHHLNQHIKYEGDLSVFSHSSPSLLMFPLLSLFGSMPPSLQGRSFCYTHRQVCVCVCVRQRDQERDQELQEGEITKQSRDGIENMMKLYEYEDRPPSYHTVI